MVAILDADKEGFLRSETSLIQTIGRAARNVNAKVILYADKVTNSMQRAIDETQRRRELQEEYNRQHGITPETIKKQIRAGIEAEVTAHRQANETIEAHGDETETTAEYINEMQKEMLAAAESLDFERAAQLRDQITDLQDAESGGDKREAASGRGRGRKGGRRRSGSRVPRPKRG